MNTVPTGNGVLDNDDGAQALAGSITGGDRRALAQAITVIESTRPDHRSKADGLLKLLLPYTGNSIRIGVSGPPGVGKSTFIEALGLHVIGAGHRLAVLAVDPSSPRTGGSILGDKTRMEKLSRRGDAFIRPSPSGGTLGGVARRTREGMLACEAAGFDVIIVETVGVGQSEVAVADLVDVFVLLLAPSGGDGLQGIKKGIVELADLVVVNKDDGEMAEAAERSRHDYAGALHIVRPPVDGPLGDGWSPKVLKCSALEGAGISEIWDAVEDFRKIHSENGAMEARRGAQAKAWMWNDVKETLTRRIVADPKAGKA
ncbi:MAG: methylmalonyl Co-A mutase-associated GTPase MeaB, partial [Rhodospirillales bacterium]